jgi:hypothetical protein
LAYATCLLVDSLLGLWESLVVQLVVGILEVVDDIGNWLASGAFVYEGNGIAVA